MKMKMFVKRARTKTVRIIDSDNAVDAIGIKNGVNTRQHRYDVFMMTIALDTRDPNIR